jgi:hypothetical protein
MKFIYHYCAKLAVAPQTVIDGVVTVNEPIHTMEQYREVKKLVCGDVMDPRKTFIMSLNLLGTDAGSENQESPANS